MTTAKPCPPLSPGETRVYPVLALRDIVVFPHMIAPLFVGRKKSILALEEVMRSDTFILLVTQKTESDDEPATEAMYEFGTLASLLQLLKLPDGTVKVLVEGAQRAKVVKYTDCSEYYESARLTGRSSPTCRAIGPCWTDARHISARAISFPLNEHRKRHADCTRKTAPGGAFDRAILLRPAMVANYRTPGSWR
jgi:ATP-dependent Lon protease